MIYEKEIEFAKALAREAGEIMHCHFRLTGSTWKDDNTPLTVADTMINRLVIDRVKAAFPDHGVIGEEESTDERGERYSWVVDPIDGTGPFVFGAPLSMFSLALVGHVDGQPLVAVTYDPVLDDLYWAIKGAGVYVNEKKIETGKSTILRSQFVSLLGGKGIPGGVHLSFGSARERFSESGARVVSLFAHVYPASRVASGELATAILGYGSPWDAAAVALLVTEAGGVASDMDGQQRRYDEFANGVVLSANRAIHDEVLHIIQETAREDPRD